VSVRSWLTEEVWIKDLRTGEESALTASRVNKYFPTISPDGSLVGFNEVPSYNVYVVPSNGGVAENVCTGCGEATDWSSDGKRILGNTTDGKAWVLDVATRTRTDLLATRLWTATWCFSPDNRWFSFLVVGKNTFRAYIARVDDAPVPESKWIEIMNDVEAWSHDGNLLYGQSSRDGHSCIWAQLVHPTTRQPVGAPFAVFHAHSPRRSLAPENILSITTNKIVFGMAERTGNIWMAEWKEH